ncbi:hypothetical protein ACVXG8_23900 [Escherichia coli]
MNALGHAHPELREALNEQASSSGIPATVTPTSGTATGEKIDRRHVCRSRSSFVLRAEANEAALKLARKSLTTATAAIRAASWRSKMRFMVARCLLSVRVGSQPIHRISRHCRRIFVMLHITILTLPAR